MSDTTPTTANASVVIPGPALNIDAPAPTPEAKPETEVAKPADATPPESEAAPEADKTEDQPRDTKGKFAKRIEKMQGEVDQLTWRKRTAEAELASLEARAADIRKALETAPKHDENDFAAAETHRLRSAIKTEQVEQIEHDAAAARQRVADIQEQTFNLAVEAAAERIPDIRQTLASYSGPKISPHASSVLTESPKAAEIAYHIAKNPDVAQRMQFMSPAQQGAEIARIEARLEAAPQARKTTQAAPPPPSLGGSRSPAVKDVADMSVAEIQAYLAKAR